MSVVLPVLTAAARDVLETAALAGPVLDVDLLCRACGCAEEPLVAVLEEAAALGLIEERAGQLLFSAGVREALYAGQLSVRRTLRHKRLAAVVDDPDDQAYHLGQAGVAEAVPHLRTAGDRAMRAGDRLRARGYYQRALELTRGPEPELLLLTALSRVVPEVALLEQAATVQDSVVSVLARYYLAVWAPGGDAARCLVETDRVHKDLAALWRNERLEALLELTDGRGRQVCGAPGALALAYWRSGRPAEAEILVRESLMEGGASAQGPLEQWVLAGVATLRGDLDEAFRRYDLAVADALVRRDVAAAARHAREWLDLITFSRGTEKEEVERLATRVRELTAEAEARVGAAPERRPPAPVGRPGSQPRYGEYGEALWSMSQQARTCLQAGDLAVARSWLETVDAWHAGPRPSLWHFALNRLEWARWHAAVGDVAASQQVATEALEWGERFGAATALVIPALKLLGRPAPGQSAAPTRSDGLTGREAEIAALVAQGLTDREIGERLYISPRTVDGHLRNIFRKLDLQSRTGLAAWVLAGE